jgi:hypothetical protein
MNSEVNLKTILGLLNDFELFLKNRSISFLVFIPEVFPKILCWHFLVWQKEKESLNKEEETSLFLYYNEITRILDYIIEVIEERALKQKEAFYLFKYFKEHLNNNKNSYVKVNGDRKYYREDLLDIFCEVFFENVDGSPEKYGIWEHYFPIDWKIIITNLKDDNNYISIIFLNSFLEWCQERISHPKGEFDKKLEEVNRNLFPNVDPIIWAKILIFVLAPFGHVKSTIEMPWTFGYLGRIRSYSGYWGEKGEREKKIRELMNSQDQLETKNTFELTFYLFKEKFSKENLINYIEELERLKYNEDTSEERKRLSLLDVFKNMLEFMSENEK